MKNKIGSSLWGFLILLSACGGGTTTTTRITPPRVMTVTGVAASGLAMTGQAFLKDSAGHAEMSTPIGAQGAFSFNVGGRSAPYMLRAGSLYSMSASTGRANINPLTSLMIAEMGGFSTPAAMDAFYANPDPTRLRTMINNMSTARERVRQVMAPLFSAYGVTDADPIQGIYTIGQGIDRMFDDVKMTINGNGQVTMMYANGTTLYTGPMGNMMAGIMMSGNIMMPTPTTTGSGLIIQPVMAGVLVGQTFQFSANLPVTWSVISANGGTISPSGLYTAPPTPGVFLIKATSTADAGRFATATVHVGSMGMNMGM